MKMTLKKKDQTKRAKIKSKKDTENHRKCLFNPRSDNLSPTSTCYTYTTAVQTKLHTHTSEGTKQPQTKTMLTPKPP